jgi:hypothetical protein
MSFEDDVRKWADKSIARVTIARKKIAFDVFTRVVIRTPVGNPRYWKIFRKGYVGGRLRANWQCSIGTPADGVQDTVDQSRPMRSIASSLGHLKPDSDASIFLNNNLPYAKPVEDGWSKQAPSGMVGITVAEFQGIVQEAVRGS